MPRLRTDSFYQELAERLALVMPADVTVSPSSKVAGLNLAGLSGKSGFLSPTLLIRGPFRFRLRLSAKLVLRDVQGFVVLELHRAWPAAPANEARASDDLPKPRATVTRDSLRLWYERGGRPVLELAPIPLDRVRG
jgi:hypothetical protein